ncbi:MAG: transketolase C-terminal domain-containing protein [Verrucomicrobiota bacterium]|jgi:transketolase|nr:transketolase C-terminal domain-containing protein [Verrucomicrobiota bacterium]MDD8046198.1 transketolase C-terminal domain-containing protein [Verrucomicrobiota bacterium]MDI9382986.1 transketolase C-terminal domain-containing protein [Verrucomicrobiota bacterium]
MGKASRASFGMALAEFGTDPRVVILDADLSKSTKSADFGNKFPDRFFNVGITEAGMIGTAAGLALCGKIPFCCSFACFVTGRYDQIRVSVGYTNANVRIVGTHAGVAIGEDGYSQQGLEDIATVRSLPNMTILQPADHLETVAAVKYLIQEHQGPVYLRLTRQNLDEVHSEGYTFQFGQADRLREGSDLTIIATGGVVGSAIHAAKALAEKGVQADVLNIHTIRPIDRESIVESAARTGRVVTVEDHSIVGGLGSAVAEVLSEEQPTRLLRIGMTEYGESGSPEDLYQKFGLNGPGVLAKIESWLEA